MKLKQIISAVIAGITVMSCASCAGNNQTAEAAVETVASAETSADSVEIVNIDPKIEAVDCNGAEFITLSRAPKGEFTFPYFEFLVEEETGEALNDAVYKRNMYIEEKYNLKLVNKTDNDVAANVKNSVLANESLYDLAFPMHQYAFSMMTAGYLCNISELPYIDITKPYWMEKVMNNTSIGGQIYFVTGDLNLSALNGVGLIYFNKKVAANLKIDNLYETVKSGKWTLDTFTECCKGVTRDLNGDNVLNGADDMFGLTTNGFVWQAFLAGCDTVVVGKDKNDKFILDWDTEKNIGIITRIVDLLNDRDITILINQYPDLISKYGGIGQSSIAMFREDRALFWIENLYASTQQRDMNSDFGFLPMPKLDENQEKYACHLNMNHTSTTVIPLTNTNTDLTCCVLEDMAYMSSLTVRPAFYDVSLQGKITRDNESGEMLDLIYANINIDPTLIMAGNLPVDKIMRAFLINNTTSFMSEIASNKEAIEATLDKITAEVLGR